MNTISRNVYANPAVATGKSKGGTHGGEMLAPMKSHNTMPVEPKMYEHIQSVCLGPLRVIAMYANFKHTKILFIAAYFYDSIGIEDDLNHDIFKQIYLLMMMCGLPIIVFGDFNATPEEVSKSGWLAT